jgi:hypothetical protein
VKAIHYAGPDEQGVRDLVLLLTGKEIPKGTEFIDDSVLVRGVRKW